MKIIDTEKNTEIYLKFKKNAEDCESIEDCVQFSDNRGGFSKLGNHQNFTSQVNSGKLVIWMGAKGSERCIDILEVKFKKEMAGNINILEETEMRAEGSSSIVIGKVKPKEDGIKDGSIEHYAIVFCIDGIKYTIDPMLLYH